MLQSHPRSASRLALAVLPAAVLTAAMVTFATGVAALVSANGEAECAPWQRGAGLVLLLLAGGQVWLLPRLRRRQAAAYPLGRPWALAAFLSASALAAYAVCLVVGPRPGVAWLFVTILAAVLTAGMLLASGKQPLVCLAGRWLPRRRGLRWAGIVALLLPLGVEAGLRLYAWAGRAPITATYLARRLVLRPGSDYQGRLVNGEGYWDDEFDPAPRPDDLRVAVLGDEAVLAGDWSENLVCLLERDVPGLDVLNFSLPRASPREYAALLQTQVLGYCPDLVAVFLSIGDDVTHPLPEPAAFDYRSLYAWQVSATTWGGRFEDRPACAAPPPAAVEEQVSRLQVCLTPPDANVSRQWCLALDYLEQMHAACRENGVPLLLVLVPEPYQFDPRLRQRLCRWGGVAAEAIDVELPQRRLTSFAQAQGIACLDLLPEFRRAGVDAEGGRLASAAGKEASAAALCRWLAHTCPQRWAALARRQADRASALARSAAAAGGPAAH